MSDTDAIKTPEEKLDGMLAAVGMKKKASYNRAEVCRVLGISERTFWRYVTTHEVDAKTGAGVSPWTIDSYKIHRHHRVRHEELASYLARNRTYERINAPDSDQLRLPGF